MKIAFLTAGGIAPCLSSSISMLIQEYKKQNINCEFIGYLYIFISYLHCFFNVYSL